MGRKQYLKKGLYWATFIAMRIPSAENPKAASQACILRWFVYIYCTADSTLPKNKFYVKMVCVYTVQQTVHYLKLSLYIKIICVHVLYSGQYIT